MDPRELRAMRREQIERRLASDLSTKEWCRLNGVSQSTYYKWVQVFKEEEPGLFERSTREWIEVGRAALKAEVALAPRPADAGAEGAAPAGPAAAQGEPAGACIRAMVNGVELLVPPGAAEADLAAVFRAARA